MSACITTLDQLYGYDISPETAFVPELVTAFSLPPLFAPIEALVSDPPLADAISSLKLRSKVGELPQYQRDDFVNLTLAEKRRLFVILTFVAHGYVWGNLEAPVETQLPEEIAIPLVHLGEILGITPLGTYASTVLWNSRLKDHAKGWILDNVLIDFTFTGTDDESLFYKVSVCVEVAGARALASLLAILFETRHEHPSKEKMRELFAEVQESLQEMLKILKKVSGMDPKVFYWKIRPYFAGWRLVKPRGVHYAGIDAPSMYRTYLGISAHQSTLFQALDFLLGVSHRPGEAYLQEIRKHMPSPHAEFLECLRTHFTDTLKTFVKDQPNLKKSYNGSLETLASFRETHQRFVKRYAVDSAALSSQAGFGLAQPVKSGGGVMGAGGTEIGNFLKFMLVDTRLAQLPVVDSRYASGDLILSSVALSHGSSDQ